MTVRLGDRQDGVVPYGETGMGKQARRGDLSPRAVTFKQGNRGLSLKSRVLRLKSQGRLESVHGST